MSFNLSGYATLLALTVSSAGGAENPEPYVTLKIEAVQQTVQPVLEALGGADADLAALMALHDPSDADLNPRFFGLGAIEAGAEYKGRHTLTLGGVEVRAAKVSHIKVTPSRGGHWIITCNVGIEQPPPRAIDRWAEILRGRETRVILAADPELNLTPAAAPAHPYDAAVGELKRMAEQDGCATIAAVKIAAAAIAGDTKSATKYSDLNTKARRGKPTGKQSPAA